MWITPDSSTTRWLKRMPVSVDNTAASSSPQDVNVDLAALGDYFWDAVDTDGDSIRVTRADGHTLEAFELVSWSKANRTGTLEVDGATLDGAAGFDKLWVYFESTNASIATGSTTVPAQTSPKTGHLVRRCEVRGPVIPYRPQRRGASKPREVITKGPTEVLHLFWDFSAALVRFQRPQSGALVCEELAHASMAVLVSESDQTAIYTAADTRFIGSAVVRTTIKAGAADTDYTPSLTVHTTEGRALNARALLKVQTVNET